MKGCDSYLQYYYNWFASIQSYYKVVDTYYTLHIKYYSISIIVALAVCAYFHCHPVIATVYCYLSSFICSISAGLAKIHTIVLRYRIKLLSSDLPSWILEACISQCLFQSLQNSLRLYISSIYNKIELFQGNFPIF